jgi:ATP synthase protein I
MTESAPNDFITVVKRAVARFRRARAVGEPSVSWQLGQIGVLGWIVVTPLLAGLFFGRWLDHQFATGIFWTAALIFIGGAFGFWSAWRWMHNT